MFRIIITLGGKKCIYYCAIGDNSIKIRTCNQNIIFVFMEITS